MLSVQSAVQSPAIIGSQLGSDGVDLSAMTKVTVPSCDSGVETSGVGESPELMSGDTTDAHISSIHETSFCPEGDETVTAEDADKSVSDMTPSRNCENENSDKCTIVAGTRLCSNELLRPSVVISSDDTDNNRSQRLHDNGHSARSELRKRRWVSTELLPVNGPVSSVDVTGSVTVLPSDDSQSKGVTSRGSVAIAVLKSRRWTSECALNLSSSMSGLSLGIKRDTEMKADDGSSSIVSDNSNARNVFRLFIINNTFVVWCH